MKPKAKCVYMMQAPPSASNRSWFFSAETSLKRRRSTPLEAENQLLHQRPAGIVIGHQRTSLERVDVLEDEIPVILDPLPADVAPIVAIARNLALVMAAIAHPREEIVEQDVDSRQPLVGPVNSFRLTGMIGAASGVVPEDRGECSRPRMVSSRGELCQVAPCQPISNPWPEALAASRGSRRPGAGLPRILALASFPRSGQQVFVVRKPRSVNSA